MKQLQNFLAIAIIISSCVSKKKENIDGGPCSYDDKVYPAKLIKLLPTPDSSAYNALFEVDMREGVAANQKDTLDYSRVNNRSITPEQIKKDSIETGKVYKYVFSTITSGTCDPKIEMIRLEKY